MVVFVGGLGLILGILLKILGSRVRVSTNLGVLFVFLDWVGETSNPIGNYLLVQ